MMTLGRKYGESVWDRPTGVAGIRTATKVCGQRPQPCSGRHPLLQSPGAISPAMVQISERIVASVSEDKVELAQIQACFLDDPEAAQRLCPPDGNVAILQARWLLQAYRPTRGDLRDRFCEIPSQTGFHQEGCCRKEVQALTNLFMVVYLQRDVVFVRLRSAPSDLLGQKNSSAAGPNISTNRRSNSKEGCLVPRSSSA